VAKVELVVTYVTLIVSVVILGAIALSNKITVSNKTTRSGDLKRPEWNTVYENTAGGYVACGCGAILQFTSDVYSHWKLGHFDR